MDGNGSSTSSTSPRSNNNGNLQLPSSSNGGGPPRRPAPAVRLPSCQIQRNWDRGEASTNNSNTSAASAASAAAAAARRRRAATVASPIREYPPALEHHTTSAGILYPATSRQSRSNRNDDNNTTTTTQQQHPEYQLNVTPAPGGDGHIYIVDPNNTALRDDDNNDNSNDKDKPQQGQGWGAALSRGRKRAATTAAALGRTVTGYTGSNNDRAGRDFGDEEATRRARANSHASIEIGSNTNPIRGEAYDSQVHDMLDVIDPEVQTVNLLGDIQNAFFIPPNRLFDRTRKLQLTRPPESKESGVGGGGDVTTGEGGAPVKYTPPRTEAEQAAADARRAERLAQQEQQAQGETQAGTGAPAIPPIPKVPGEAISEKPQATSSGQTGEGEGEGEVTSEKPLPSKPLPPSASELEGHVKEPSTAIDTEELILANQKYVKGRYFVLPSKLVDMTDWTDQEKADLDDYVRHLMHNKKEIFRRRMRGFGKYVRTRECFFF